MAITEFKAALNQVATERGIAVEEVLESLRSALVSAYKKDFGDELAKDVTAQTIETPKSEQKETPEGTIEAEEEIEVKDPIEAVVDPDTGEAKILNNGKDVTPSGFGRIAAQTAKQVILQKIRETEKQVIFEEFEEKIGTLINGTIFRIEAGKVILDLGKAHGLMPTSEQVKTENYRTNQRLKVLVKDVKQGARATDIIVSRADSDFVKKLFEQEVPEISSGTVVIEAIAREPGSRTKMAVSSTDDKIDPVGSCVGQKGVRVQSIISELFGEKIDIIPFSSLPEKFIAASLSPARVTDVEINDEEKKAVVTVPEDQQSLAIGKEGQNARLANKLTHWKIDIKGAAGIFDMETGELLDNGDSNKQSSVVGVWDAAIKKVAEESKATDEAKAKVEEEKTDE